jgi:hypothetical protein
VFKIVKKAAVSFALKSFAGRLSVVTALHESGKLTDVGYEYQKGQILMEYRDYLATVPRDLVPDWAKQIA